MKLSWLASIALATAFSWSAHADDIRLGVPGYAGTGCPGGSASVTLAPDQKSLSILFDQYVVEAGGVTGKRIDRKNCNIAIPVHVPQGFSISVFQVDYRGFNALPWGSRSTLSVEYFFSNFPQSVRQSKNFFGPTTDSYTQSQAIQASALVWTPCGADTNLRVNTSMMVTSNAQGEQALSTVDSADVSAGLIYWLQWRKCR